MFKFVTQSPKQLKSPKPSLEYVRQHQALATTAKERNSASTSHFFSSLNKQQNKRDTRNFTQLKTKEGGDRTNQDLNQRSYQESTSTIVQTCTSSAKKINTSSSCQANSKNVVRVKLEVNSKTIDTDDHGNLRKAADGKIRIRNLSNGLVWSCGCSVTDTCSICMVHVVKNQTAVNGLNPSSNDLKRNLRSSVADNCRLSSRDKGVHFRFFNGTNLHQVGNNTMTHDYYTFSDSESDMTWLGQPSPILLTSSPPQSAVKVPATKCATTSFEASASAGNYTNGKEQQYYISSFQNENGFAHHEDNSLVDECFNNYPEVFIQQEATNLFCDSLRNTVMNARSFPYTVDTSENDFKYANIAPESYGPRNGMIDHSYNHSSYQHHYPPKNGVNHPSCTGAIFVGGPLFISVEDENGEHNNNSYLVERRSTRDGSNGSYENTTTTHSSNSIKTNKRPLFESTNITKKDNSGHTSPRINIHSEQSQSEHQHNGVDKEGFENETVISVDKAKCEKPSNGDKLNNRADQIKTTTSVKKLKEKTRKDFSGKPTQRETYFAMNSLPSNHLGRDPHHDRNGNGEIFKRRDHKENSVIRQLDEDEDDDASTLSLATMSEDEVELSSSSSSSTTCGSASSGRYIGDVVPGILGANGSGYGHDANMKNNSLPDPCRFVIQKIECFNNRHISSAPKEMQGGPPVLRSQSTRERLNAVAEYDNTSLTDICNNGYTLQQKNINWEREIGNQQKLESFDQPDMPSLSQFSPLASPNLQHSRVLQLKEEGSPRHSRRSQFYSNAPVHRQSRCRSLDRGSMRSSFPDRSLSPTYSDLGRGRKDKRSHSNPRIYSVLDSRSESGLPIRRTGRLRRYSSVGSSLDDQRSNFDVTSNLSALLCNPLDGGENDRHTLHDYLKTSTRNKYQIDPQRYESDWHTGRYAISLRVGDSSLKSGSGSSYDAESPGGPGSALESTYPEEISWDYRRESKVISKSQTPNRYPAVELSPRSINSLLPSPRRNATSNVITITDNDAIDNETEDREDNYSSTNESHHETDSVEIEDALSRLTHAVKENLTRGEFCENTQYTHLTQETLTEERKEAISVHNSSLQYCLNEVNINMTNHPISKDLAVIITKKPITTSSNLRRSVSNPRKSSQNKTVEEPKHRLEMDEEKPKGNFTSSSKIEPPTKRAIGPGKNEEPVYINMSFQQDENSNLLSGDVKVKCRNPFCRKQMCLEDAKSRFKSCHHCYTYYCSQQCRLKHWERHKMKCVFARTNSDCKKVLRMGREEDVVMQAFTRVARTGYLSRGRGCVRVQFSSPERAEKFISEGLFALEALPIYLTVGDLKYSNAADQEGRGDDGDLIALIETCEDVYNPDTDYVLQICISVPLEVIVRYDRPYRRPDIQKMVLHAINPLYKSKDDSNTSPCVSTDPETLILTPPTTVPDIAANSKIKIWEAGSQLSYFRDSATSTSSISTSTSPMNDSVDEKVAKRARQLSFINIQRKLREKGVTLRHQYPDVYRKLCSYVNNGTHFTPVVIYPRDVTSGKNFMCLVMPESEPQILGWVRTPGLLDDITTG